MNGTSHKQSHSTTDTISIHTHRQPTEKQHVPIRSVTIPISKSYESLRPNIPARDIHGWRWVLIVVSLCSAMFLWGLDGTLTAGIQATIISEFQSPDKLAFISAAFFLGAAATVLTWNQVLGQFNCKRVFILSLVIYEVGSALCGAAGTIDVLIAGRAIAGVGGCGMYVSTLTLLSMSTKWNEKAMYMAWPALTWGIGMVLGPVIGGAFAGSSATWRWGYYINLCTGAFFSPVYLLLLPSKDPQPNTYWRARLYNIDFLGSTLLAGCMTSLVLAICFGGLTFPWTSGSMIALWVVSGVLFILFAAQQATGYGARQVVFPVRMLQDFRVIVISIIGTCAATACFLPIYFIPLYFQYIKIETALAAAVHLLPLLCFGISTVLISAAIIHFTGRWNPCLFCAGAMVVIGGALLYTVHENSSIVKVYGFSVILGIGWGASLQIPLYACQELVDPDPLPAAMSLVTWGQLAAPAITLSIANAVFLNQAKTTLSRILPAGLDALEIISALGTQYSDVFDEDTRQAVVHAVVQAMAQVYVLVFIAGALTLILSAVLCIRLQRYW